MHQQVLMQRAHHSSVFSPHHLPDNVHGAWKSALWFVYVTACMGHIADVLTQHVFAGHGAVAMGFVLMHVHALQWPATVVIPGRENN
jgi:hypothetical protein